MWRGTAGRYAVRVVEGDPCPWKPTARGELIVAAMLTSSNASLALRMPFTLP